MSKLCQIIAVANGKKSRVKAAVSEVYHKMQNSPLFSGMEKSYRPNDEEGDDYPGESKRLQMRALKLFNNAADEWSSLFDVVATQDLANTKATADVVVGDEAVLQDVPVTTLLFLEKQLVDVRAMINALPLLDPTKEWSYSKDADCFKSDPIKRTKTKKVPKFHVAYEATKEHPAQVDKDYEDVLEGFWTTVEFSGAIDAARKNKLLSRVDSLIDAVKVAREVANSFDVAPAEIGESVFDFLLEDI